MNAFDTAALFKALSVPPRLAIVRILAAQPDGLTVVKLIEKMKDAGFSLEQETVSHHLKTLRYAGLVTYRKAGLCHYYSLCPAPFAAMAEALSPFTGNVEVAV